MAVKPRVEVVIKSRGGSEAVGGGGNQAAGWQLSREVAVKPRVAVAIKPRGGSEAAGGGGNQAAGWESSRGVAIKPRGGNEAAGGGGNQAAGWQGANVHLRKPDIRAYQGYPHMIYWHLEFHRRVKLQWLRSTRFHGCIW